MTPGSESNGGRGGGARRPIPPYHPLSRTDPNPQKSQKTEKTLKGRYLQHTRKYVKALKLALSYIRYKNRAENEKTKNDKRRESGYPSAIISTPTPEIRCNCGVCFENGFVLRSLPE